MAPVLTRLALTCITTFGLLAAPAAAIDAPTALAGTYKLTGWDPGVPTSQPPSYAGKLILEEAGAALKAEWRTNNEEEGLKGRGVVKGVGGKRVLALAFDDGSGPNVAVYDISADGRTLTGEWVAGGVGHELAQR